MTAPTQAARPVPRARLVFPAHFLLTGGGLALAGGLFFLTWPGLRRETDFTRFLLRTDFPAFLTGARMIANGQGALLYDPAAQVPVQAALMAPYTYPGGLLPYNHLPFLAVALAPFTAWPAPAIYALWLGATLLVLLLALLLLATEIRALARTPMERRWAPLALVTLGLAFVPVYQCVLQVQTAPWDLLGYTLMIRALRREQPVAAGLALALVLVKPQLLIVPLAILLYERRWQTLGVFAAFTAALSLAVTPLLGGPAWIGRYLQLLANVAAVTGNSSTIKPPFMENLRGFFTRLAASLDPSLAGSGNAPWVLPATVLASLAVLALVARVWRGHVGQAWQADPGGWDTRWAVALIATLLVNPHGLPYELTLLILPATLLWRAARESATPRIVPRTAALLAAGYVASTVSLAILSIPGWPLHLGVLAMALALVFLTGSRWGKAPSAAVPAGT